MKWKPQSITQERHNIGQGSKSDRVGVTSLSGSKEGRGRLCRQRYRAGYLEHEQQLHLAHAPDHCVYLLVSSSETETLFDLQGSRRPPAFTTLWKIYPIVSHECSCTTVNMIYLPGLMKTNQLWCHFRSQDKSLLGWVWEKDNDLYHPYSYVQLHPWQLCMQKHWRVQRRCMCTRGSIWNFFYVSCWV